MAGRDNIYNTNQTTLFKKHNKSLMNQVELWYIKDKFAVQTEYDGNKALYSYLLKDMLITHDCELIKFLNKLKYLRNQFYKYTCLKDF